MARQDSKKPEQIKVDKDVSALDVVAKRILSTIDNTYDEKIILNNKASKLHKIINDELQLAKGVSQGNIVDFVSAVSVNKDPNNRDQKVDIDELFTQDVGNLFGYFQDTYKNKYVELADLKFITKFIPAIGEAVKVTLDSIVGADDLSSILTRVIELPKTLTEEEASQVIEEIERIEKEEKLLRKLKNVDYKKALISGVHYVYAVPYAELFNEYERLKAKGKINKNPLAANPNLKPGAGKTSGFNIKAQESYEDTTDSFAYESINLFDDSVIENLNSSNMFNKEDIAEIKKSLKTNTLPIQVSDSEYPIDALESVASYQAIQNHLGNYINKFESAEVQYKDFASSGTYDINKANSKPKKFNTKGTYIKHIDAKYMLKIKIFDEVIGYFYVRDTPISKKDVSTQSITNNTLFSIGSNLFNSTKLTENKRNAAIRSIVDTISEGIIDKFSNKFVNKNSEFKRIIADCIIQNGLVNNQFQIQFIPAKYVIPFVINENEDGDGESILADSLFPAKLLLSLVVNKLLTYLNKGGNKTIAHIKKGPINLDGGNHIQRVIRMLQESQITFSDLLSTNLTFAKFARDGNLSIPSAKNGDRLVEFEVQEGQQVDMKPEMEEWLEKMAIMGTGVPSVIMEYTDAADYAKSIVTANIKFAGRVASLQGDLEDPTTDLYKILLLNSNLDEELKNKAIQGLKFVLPRPKVLANQNISEYLSTIQQSAQMQSDIIFGTNGTDDNDPSLPKVKDEFIKMTVAENSPFIDWNAAEERRRKAVLSVKEKEKIAVPTGDDNSDNGGLSDEFGGTGDESGGEEF